MSGPASSFSEVEAHSYSFGQSNGLINTLSPEVLTEIFLNATYVDYPRTYEPLLASTGQDDILLRLPDLSTSSAPLKLCHVCGRWREIALNASILWSRFSLNYSDTRNAKVKAKMWITNSRQFPLTFSFHAAQNMSLDLNDEREFRAWRYILRLLASHAHRWQHVSIELLDIRLSSIAVASFAKTGPLLETAILKTAADSQHLQLPEQLKRLQLGSRLGTIHPTPLLPLKRLEYLNLSSIDGPSLLLVVQETPCLSALKAFIALLATSYASLHIPSLETTVRHTNRLILHLGGDGAGLAFVLQSLILPQLDAVTLQTDSSTVLNSLLHLLHRSRTGTSFPPLRLLNITPQHEPAHRSLSTDLMKLLLIHMPRLNILAINHMARLDDSLLRAFTYREENKDVLCPELMYLIWKSDAKCTKGVFAAMLLSRWKQIPLRLIGIKVTTLPFSRTQLLAELILSGGIPNGVRLDT